MKNLFEGQQKTKGLGRLVFPFQLKPPFIAAPLSIEK